MNAIVRKISPATRTLLGSVVAALVVGLAAPAAVAAPSPRHAQVTEVIPKPRPEPAPPRPEPIPRPIPGPNPPPPPPPPDRN